MKVQVLGDTTFISDNKICKKKNKIYIKSFFCFFWLFLRSKVFDMELESQVLKCAVGDLTGTINDLTEQLINLQKVH